MSADIAQAIVAAVALVWAIYQTIATRKLAKMTSDLSQQVHWLKTNLDQSIQRLHRAQELVNQIHEIEVFFLYENPRQPERTEQNSLKEVELSSHKAELRGLAFAIGDKELLDIVNEGPPRNPDENLSEAWKLKSHEASARTRSQRLHTRISQLLQEITHNDLHF